MSLAGTRCTLADHRCWTTCGAGLAHTVVHVLPSITSSTKCVAPSRMPQASPHGLHEAHLHPPGMYLPHTHRNLKRPCCLLLTSTCPSTVVAACRFSNTLADEYVPQSSCCNWIRYARLMHCSICLLGRAHTMSFRDQNICLLRIRYSSCQVPYSPSLRDTPRIPAIQPLQILPCPHRTECTLCSHRNCLYKYWPHKACKMIAPPRRCNDLSHSLCTHLSSGCLTYLRTFPVHTHCSLSHQQHLRLIYVP